MKHCPFCGGEALLKANRASKGDWTFFFVKCDVCGAQSKAFSERYISWDDIDPDDIWDYPAAKSALRNWERRANER